MAETSKKKNGFSTEELEEMLKASKARDKQKIKDGIVDVFENFLGRKIKVGDAEKFSIFLATQERNGKHFTKAMNGTSKVPAAQTSPTVSDTPATTSPAPVIQEPHHPAAECPATTEQAGHTQV
jgi:hypothetical protein